MDEFGPVCSLGVLLVVGTYALLERSARKASQRTLEARVTELENEVGQAKFAFWQMRQRVDYLEQTRAQPPAVEAARPPFVAGEVTPAAPPVVEAPPVPIPPTSEEVRADARRLLTALQEAREERTRDAASEAPATEPAALPDEPPRAPEPAPLPEKPTIDLEQWLGVRGAAVLGAALLVLAGAYFFKYSVDHELISTTMRVIIGTVAGIGCMVASETVLRKRHDLLANAIGGTGSAILYLSFWAAVARYHLIGTGFSALLMIAVTAACCALSVRHGSVVYALFGLIGGFATPIMLSTGADRPITLFGYLLILDAALLWVARKQRSTLVGGLCLAFSALYQLYWIIGKMGPDRVVLGMSISLVFALVFVLGPNASATNEGPVGEEKLPRLPQGTFLAAVGTGLPFLFAFYFGANAELSPEFYLTGGFTALLLVGALVVAWRQQQPLIGLGAVAASLGVLCAWLLVHSSEGARAWQASGFLTLVALLALGAAELERLRPGDVSAPLRLTLAPTAVAIAGGSIIALASAMLGEMVAWPWLAAICGLTAISLRLGSLGGERAVLLIGAAGLGLALMILPGRAVAPGVFVVVLLIVAAGFQLATLLWRGEAARVPAHAAAMVAMGALIGLTKFIALPAPAYVAAVLVAVVLVCLATRRSGAAPWLIASAVLAAGVLSLRAWAPVVPAREELLAVFVGHGVAVVLLTGWPFLLGRSAREGRSAYRAAALAAPVFAPGMLVLHHQLYGWDFIGLTPVALAALVLGALLLSRVRSPEDVDVQLSASAWLGAVALGFITAAIPLQLRDEWVTIAWSLHACATLALWRRVDHAGLKYFALALFAVVTVRLIGNPYLLEYHPRGSLRIVNWLAYTYLVPATCLLGGLWLVGERESERRRPWEYVLVGRPLLGVATILVVFAWINLAIFDWYSSEGMLSIALEREPARDLTLSIAWALYGIVLLGIGLWRGSRPLRGASLAMVLVTCGKVFLYDLAYLSDLYRVMSLVGLALSLIGISLAYKRFVFRGDDHKVAARERTS